VFKIFDVAGAPEGWMLASTNDLNNKYHEQFVNFYNKNNGLQVLRSFQSRKCCVAVKGDQIGTDELQMLTIEDEVRDKGLVQFLVNEKGKTTCNPLGGYVGRFRFMTASKLLPTNRFGSSSVCGIDHNPAIYVQIPSAPGRIQGKESTKLRRSSADCSVSAWGVWSRCSCRIGRVGSRSRKREIVKMGRQCPVLEQIVSCQSNCCEHTACRRSPSGDVEVLRDGMGEGAGVEHRCSVGLFVDGECDCECGVHLGQEMSQASSEVAHSKALGLLLKSPSDVVMRTTASATKGLFAYSVTAQVGTGCSTGQVLHA
jgi:hypothetical protein